MRIPALIFSRYAASPAILMLLSISACSGSPGASSDGSTAGTAGSEGSAGIGGIAGGAGIGGIAGGAGTGGMGGAGGPGAGGVAGGGLGGASGRGGAGSGAAGAGGSGVGGAAGAEGTGDCVDLSHLGARWRGGRDLRVIGTDFGAAEGQTVRLVITYGEPRSEPSYGLAETAIRSGSFEIALPQAVGNYTGMGVYIDEGKDDACTLNVDVSWQMTTGGDLGSVTWQITPIPKPAESLPLCNINGIFDLTKPLPCPG